MLQYPPHINRFRTRLSVWWHQSWPSTIYQQQRPSTLVGVYLWLAVSINTSNSYGDLELRSRRFHFDLVYFENLECRIKSNLINPFRERLFRNSTSNPDGDFELRSRRFRFDLVYFENLERRIKCNLIFLYMFTILRSKFRRRRRRNETACTSTPDFRSLFRGREKLFRGREKQTILRGRDHYFAGGETISREGETISTEGYHSQSLYFPMTQFRSSYFWWGGGGGIDRPITGGGGLLTGRLHSVV